MRGQTIFIHPLAPPKPPTGVACNGCGVCCLSEPCPLGMLVSRRRHGACAALRWSDLDRRYLCGVVSDPVALWPALPRWIAPMVSRLARRWIGASIGCDADTIVVRGG